MAEQLFSQLAEAGYRGRIVPIERLHDLREDLEVHYQQALIDPELYQTYLAGFSFEPPETLPGAKSIVIVAVPEPRIQIAFAHNGERLPVILPPTYPERETDRRVGAILAGALAPGGYRVVRAVLPKKLLAVRSGLAAYGKNNIAYVPGMGSFCGLVTVFSDLPAPEGAWREAEMMEACSSCVACRRHCPTGAIDSERFLLHAEQCLTFHNEKPGDVPFPAWIDPSWHNSLVGCMHCQRVCPMNREVWPWVEEGVEFSPEETGLILEGVPLAQLPDSMLVKMRRYYLDAYAPSLARNLGALLRPCEQ
jgi:epoxyqueuosine reductase